MLLVDMEVAFDKATASGPSSQQVSLKSLARDDGMKADYSSRFANALQEGTCSVDLDDRAARVAAAIHTAAQVETHTQKPKAKQPWISASTLDLIAERCRCRGIGDWAA